MNIKFQQPEVELGLVFILAISALLLLSQIFVGFGIENGISSLNLIYAYDGDEARATELLLKHIEEGNLNPFGFFNYGRIYSSIAYFFCQGQGCDSFGAALILRSISFLSYIAGGLLIGLTVNSVTDRPIIAIAAAVASLAIPTFFYWGQRVHPDMLQTFFVVSAFFVLAKIKDKVLAYYLAVIFSALAFGTKYSGIMVFIFAVVPFIYLNFELRKFLRHFFYGGLLFGIIFLITNPYVPINLINFLNDFIGEARHVNYGHDFPVDAGWLDWFFLLAQQSGWVLMVLFFIFLVSTLKQWIKGETEPKDNDIFFKVLAVYLIANFLFLVFRVNLVEPRYFMPVLPGVIIAASVTLARLPRSIGYLAITGHFLLVGYFAVYVPPQSENTLPAEVTEAGLWMAENLDHDIPILFEYYQYIPDSLVNTRPLLFVSNELAERYNPRILVINKRAGGRFCWPAKGTKFIDGEFEIGPGDVAPVYCSFLKQLVEDIKREKTGASLLFEGSYSIAIELKRKNDVWRPESYWQNNGDCFVLENSEFQEFLSNQISIIRNAVDTYRTFLSCP